MSETPTPPKVRPGRPRKEEEEAKPGASELVDGKSVRVMLQTPYPLFCASQNVRLLPNTEHTVVVDKFMRANIKRGNLKVL